MAQMFLVTLSEANGSDTDGKKWLLKKVCNRLQPLGKVSLATMYGSWDQLSSLIYLLCQTFTASGGDYSGLNKLLSDRLKEEEAKYSEGQLESARDEWDNRTERFVREMWDLEERREEELKARPLRTFFD